MSQKIQLPPPSPNAPMLTRMISEPAFPPEKGSKDEPMVWTVGGPHPLVPEVKVVRMFSDQSGVEVYSVTPNGDAGMRNFVPMHRIRLVEEAMSLDIFIEELADAENDEPEETEEPEEPANGQTATPAAS